MPASLLHTGNAKKFLAAAFVIITLVLLGGGYCYYRAQAEAVRQSSYENIATIAKMKVEQIVQWRRERLMDVAREAVSQDFISPLGKIARNEATPENLTLFQSALEMARNAGLYTHAIALSSSGQVLLSAGNGSVSIEPATQRAVSAALAAPGGVISDFFRSPNGEVDIDTVEAVRDSGGNALGCIILRSRASDYLYPLIQSWPTRSRSAETLLVQREDEEVVFLNDLRHRSKTALSFRYSLKQTDVPAVQAVLDRHGMFDGTDYRNVEVLADLCAIPGTPWFMVAKVDQDEILAEARYRAISTGVIVGALILLAAAATAFAYAQQRAGLFRELFEAERQQREIHEQFRTILYSIGDAVITTDTEGRVRTMNPVAERLTGWTEAEANHKPLDEVFRIINQDTRAVVDNPVSTVLRSGAVVTLANHTVLIARGGTEHAIADSAAPIRDENGVLSGVVLVVSDVSEQYQIREALRRSEREYRMLFEGMLEGFAVHEILCDDTGQPVDYRFLSMNPAFERLTGLRAADAIGQTVKKVLPETEPLWIERYGRVALTGEPIQFEEYTAALGRHFKVTAFRPQPNQFAVVFEDITERKAAEARIARLTQLYAALSQCNQSIVHAASVEELLPQICRDIVEHGGMTMAWVGMVDEATGMVCPTVSFGSGTEYLDGIQISVDAEKPSGCGPIGTSIRENKPVWCGDFLNNSLTGPWHERAARYGWTTSAALPLRLRGKTIGALGIYNNEAQPLDEEVRKLLEEMANDISFALDSFAGKAEHKQAEEALRESETLQRLLLSNLPTGVVIVNPVTRCIEQVNDYVAALFGASADHLVGQRCHSFLCPASEGACPVCDLGKTVDNSEREMLRMDGSRLTILKTVKRIQLNGQEKLLECFVDITERKQTEARLRLQSGALEAAANAIVITDNKGLIEWTNAAFTTFTGYTAAEALGKTTNLLKSGKQDTAFYQHLWNTILAGEVWHGEIINRRKNGSLYAEEMTITPMKDSQGEITHFIAVKQDITERKQMEENLLRTQRMESIGTLASGVAHDLNNILTPIILSAEMLREAEQPDARECFIATIEKCAERGANVVNQVLTFARGAKGERMILQLNRLVDDMEKMMRETFPKNIAITTSIPSELWAVKGDPTQIHQILLNLCINSRDAMPDGGTLLISAENEEIDGDFAAMAPEAKAGDYAMLAVSDSGMGIQPEIIGKIFDPFFTTKEVGKGTGLGLSTVMGIVRTYGGFVTVESEEGRGSTFKIFLPAEIGDTEEQNHLPHTEIPQGAGETILLVDDEVFIAKVTALVLEKNGYKVLAAAEGTDALALYKKHASEIQIVLTDVMMPGMDGVHLARALKEINPQVKIIASTGQATEIRQAELRSLGVNVILSKPFDAKKLLSTLRDAIHAA